MSDIKPRIKIIITQSELHEWKMVNLQKLYNLFIHLFIEKMPGKRREFRLNSDIFYGSINTNQSISRSNMIHLFSRSAECKYTAFLMSVNGYFANYLHIIYHVFRN